MNGYPERIQQVIDYIEEQAEEQPSLSELAAIAGFSDYHFHRIFLVMVGIPVMDYVRKRKLAKAAYRVSHTDDRLLDIALDSGFGSQETFIRAFRKLFGMTPGTYRRRQIDTPPYSRANVLKQRLNPYLGGIRMDFRITDKPAFQVLGYALATRSTDGANLKEIPKFWQNYMQNGWGRVLNEATGNYCEYGICTDMNMATGEFTYIIGVDADDSVQVPEGTVLRSFPAATYAVFTTPKVSREKFSESIQQTWNMIYTEWFPHSDYEQTIEGVEFEYYDERCAGDENGLVQMDICIPVMKRAV
ncbi:AraC family transcriptional regulator [Gorillibacterium timonense]|uniref:AraC family transcriptional regulator n=1 Tax=Gorillibacterium timonense TaxID=1689269 RepID=UPI00071CAEE4|nr:AraC family transcriptional regulator [Gorillibacterium timonense]